MCNALIVLFYGAYNLIYLYLLHIFIRVKCWYTCMYFSQSFSGVHCTSSEYMSTNNQMTFSLINKRFIQKSQKSSLSLCWAAPWWWYSTQCASFIGSYVEGTNSLKGVLCFHFLCVSVFCQRMTHLKRKNTLSHGQCSMKKYICRQSEINQSGRQLQTTTCGLAAKLGLLGWSPNIENWDDVLSFFTIIHIGMWHWFRCYCWT